MIVLMQLFVDRSFRNLAIALGPRTNYSFDFKVKRRRVVRYGDCSTVAETANRGEGRFLGSIRFVRLSMFSLRPYSLECRVFVRTCSMQGRDQCELVYVLV